MSTIAATSTIALADLDRRDLPLAGGKGANLGSMIRAGLPVPPGFCVTADTYRAFVAAAAPAIDARISSLDVADQGALDAASEAIRAEIEALPLPAELADAIVAAYAGLAVDAGDPAARVAVRSSATAEDLPDASFAGQQETFLNVRGADALLVAVRRCWSSLWTPRAIAYRTRNGFKHEEVGLAVVVQLMIDAEVSGVLFTADPVTGNRRRTVINGSWGLGEAIVSGIVSPDGWVVDRDGTICEEEIARKERMVVYDEAGGTVERTIPGDLQERPALSAGQIDRLVKLGHAAEEHFGWPQDIEWALRDDHLYLLQSRPITTLFPLPEPRPADDDLHVYLSVNALQGVFEPLTPMGRSFFREVGRVVQGFAGAPGARSGKSALMTEAAGRLYVDATPALRNPLGRRLIQLPFRIMDPSTLDAFPVLLGDPRLNMGPLSRRKLLRSGARLARKSWPGPRRFAASLLSPTAARRRADLTVNKRVRKMEQISHRRMSVEERAAMAHVFIHTCMPTIPAQFMPVVAPGMVAWMIVERLARRWGLDTRKVGALRQGLPGNPTTEMDLELWRLSQEIKADPVARRLLAEEPPEAVAAAYKAGRLPPVAQAGLGRFLERYGHRSVREIDIGMARWSETPEYIAGAIRNYLLVDDPAMAADVRFKELEQAADAARAELIAAARAQNGGLFKALALRFLTSRMRALMGGRESPKFWAVRMISIMRAMLSGAGEDLAARGALARADDIFFLTLDEVREIDAGGDARRERVAVRRAEYAREMLRRQLPRIITSEGEVITGRRPAGVSDGATLFGVGVSPGVIEGAVRVITEPHGAHLGPGEILVAPSTDPAWTPLFLTAGGLVMEAGGMLSHGSVVAREYGLPAVVGVGDATMRLETGWRVRIDGTAGTVEVIDPQAVDP